MAAAPTTHNLFRLADTLWLERRLLEFLLFKLVSADLVLTANDRCLVGPAVAEVERVVTEVRRAASDRAEVMRSVAEDWGVDPQGLSLEEIALYAPIELWPVFVDHSEGLTSVVEEIEALAEETNRRLASAGFGVIVSCFGLGEGVPSRRGDAGLRRIEMARLPIGKQASTVKARLRSVEEVDLAEAVLDLELQETAYMVALGAFARCGQTSLLDFLG